MGSVGLEQRTNAPVTDQEKAVRDLLRNYVTTVDAKKLEEWTELFASESSYIVVSQENEERGLPLAFVYDDSKDRIYDRVIYVREIWKGHYNDYRQRHILSDATVHWVDGVVHISVNFAVYVSEPARTGSQLLTTGQYMDTVVFEDGVPKFASKKVLLDADVLPRYFVFPL